MIYITSEYITLGQFLKLANLVESGGEAKIFLKSHAIFVNGEREDRRGRKLYPCDLVKVDEKTFAIAHAD